MKKLLLSIGMLAVGALSFAQNARVQIIHNSPDPLADTVDVWVDNTLLLDDFAFRTASPFVTTGTSFEVRIQPKTSTDTVNPVFFQSVTLTANDTFIVVANGTIGSGFANPQPFGLDVFTPALESGTGMMTTNTLVYHGSPDAPTVDAYESSVPAGTVVDDISYGEFQGYLPLATADYTLEVRNQSNSAIVAAYQAPLSTLGLGGEAITVLASGFLNPAANNNGPAFGLYAATAAGGPLVALPSATIPTARVQVIHNSADNAAAAVDVWLNDAPLLDNFRFRTASPFVTAQAGVPFVVSIADSTSTDTTTAIAQYTFTLDADSTYVIVASGIVSPSGYSPATPFDLDVMMGAREVANASGNTDVLIYHGATDAPAVDVNEISVPAGALATNLAYTDFNPYLELATANYQIDVRVNSNNNLVAVYDVPLAALNLADSAITVVASGFVNPANNSNGPAFGLWVALASGGPMIPLTISTDLEENPVKALTNFNVYPNPANDQLNIEMDINVNENPEMMIRTIDGRTVVRERISNRFTNIDLSSLPAGVYMIEFRTNTAIESGKLIVR
ncbi:MAG: hypothetical protein CMP59_06340 [Flavobacteriales bacterium]|nr:hypothetical protein [Flavobacteriales bacterium]